jgi:hypothetical protein
MRNQKNEKWLGLAWRGPFKEFMAYAKHLKAVAAVKWLSLPIIGPGVITLLGWYKRTAQWATILIAVVVLFIIYYIYVKRYIGKMATLGTAEFHVEALKATRPEEYKLWQNFLQLDDFTFNGLYDDYNSLLVPRQDNSINNVLQYTMGREETLETMIQELKDEIKQYEQAVNGMSLELDKTDNVINYLVSLIAGINTNLYRFTNDVLDFADLRLVTPFTIYSVEGNKLVKLKDIGTSGSSPNEIDITLSNPEYAYAAVTAAKSETDDAYVNNPYPGRFVVAFSMRMLEGKKWVWCFHFDESDERALSLVLSNDIIEARQIRRLIHSFCLILHRRMISKEEVAPDAAEDAN